MLSERDIWLAARAMIQRYGSNAGIEAAERADEHLESGNLDLSAIWQRIMRSRSCGLWSWDRGRLCSS
jgi:hypothetical protein